MPKRKKSRVRIGREIEQKGLGPVFAVFLRRFYKPLAAVAGLVIFFLAYNAYIVDRSLADVQFALERTAKAQTLQDIKGLEMILNTVILREVAHKKIDSENIVNLDFASDVAKKAGMLNQVKDANFMLSAVFDKKRKSRNRLLLGLDDINAWVFETAGRIKDAFTKAAVSQLVIVEPDERMMFAAREFEKKGDLENAVKAYEDVLRQLPQYQGMEKVHLGFLYQKMRNFNKARFIYQEVVKNARDTQAAGFAKRLLEDLGDLKRLAEKRRLLEDAILKEFSTDKLQGLYYQLGAMDALLGDFNRAEQAYKKAADIDPRSQIGQKAIFNLGFNYKVQSKYADSEKVFRQLSEEFPQSELASDAAYWTADSLSNQARYEEAAEKFKEVKARFRDKPVASTALFRAADTYMYNLKDPQKAKELFEELKSEFGQMDISKYQTIDVSSGISAIYRDAGFKLLLEFKLEDAVAKFNQALKFNPNDARSYSGLGSAKGFMKQWLEAVENAKRAVEMAPMDSYTNANLGFVYILQDDDKSAMDVYEMAVSIEPKYAEAQYNLGWLYQNAGQFDKAMNAYKNSIKYRPQLAAAHNNLGICYWNLDKLDEAMQEFILAVQMDESLAEAHYNLGITELMHGRLKQAEAQVEKALELTKDIPQAQNVLNIIKQRIQEPKK